MGYFRFKLMHKKECSEQGIHERCKDCQLVTKGGSEVDNVYLEDSQGSLLTETIELPDSAVKGDTTPEQMLEYIKRAMGHNPIEIRLRVGGLVQIVRPVSAAEMLGNNPEAIKIARTFAEGEA